MKDYESMSDFEANKAVASIFLPCDYVFDEEHKKVDVVGTVTKLGGYGEPYEELVKYGDFDPCNNPTDAWPIIVENKIGLTPSHCGEFWEADHDYFFRDKNPLRAAMIVYLMMNEAEQ